MTRSRPVRSLLRRLRRGGVSPESEADAPAHDDGGRAIAFHELYRQLDAPDPGEREEAATLVAALAPDGAIRPVVRAYLHHGDDFMLRAAAVYGAKLTLVVGREVRLAGLSPVQRARLMDLLGASGDPSALGVVRAAARDLEPRVHVAAGAALVRLGDADGLEHLESELLSVEPSRRVMALVAAAGLGTDRSGSVLEAHLRRYLAVGGAVPPSVDVSMPLLVDPDVDLPELIAENVRRSAHALTVVTGPGTSALSEGTREAFRLRLADRRLTFSTPHHSSDEQSALLLAARDAAANEPQSRPTLIGPLPSPGGPRPPPHFLFASRGRPFTARIVFVGQQEFAVVMEWWRYIDDRAEVDTEFSAVLTALTLAGDAMDEEERILYSVAGEARREAFARALLAHRASV